MEVKIGQKVWYDVWTIRSKDKISRYVPAEVVEIAETGAVYVKFLIDTFPNELFVVKDHLVPDTILMRTLYGN